jgi:hypothetical protein
MNIKWLLLGLVFALSAPLALASEAYSAWDRFEDGAESVGSSIERGWEKIEDSIFPETEEEKREEAQERREDRAEELAEERRK